MRFNQFGFTLIEAIVTLLLVGIMSAVVLPKINADSIFDEMGYQDAIRSGLHYAGRVAVASRRYVCISVVSNTKLIFTRDMRVPEQMLNVQCNTNLPIPGKEDSCGENEICPRDDKIIALTGTNLIFDPLGRPVDNNKLALSTNSTISVAGRIITIYAETGVVE